MKKAKHFLNLAKIYFSYLLKKKKVDYLPVRLWVEVSSRCNLACRLCVNKDIEASLKGDLDFGLYRKLIDDAREYIFDVNLFHRGEPLLNKNIVEMVKYANTRGIKTRIHTNGVLLDKDLSRRLITAGLNLISFSFDGYTEVTYEKNRVGATYERTIANIIDFLKIKKELNSKTPFTIVQVMEFDEELSAEDFQEQKNGFLKKFVDLPLDKIIVRNPHNWGGLLDMEGIKKIDKNKSRIIPCTFLWYSLTVFYDGTVYLCPQDFAGQIKVGDLNKESIRDIFNNEKIQGIRERFKNKDISDLKPCNSCDRIWRETIGGIPREYLKIFLKDSIRKN